MSICVHGLGQVGLATASLFANNGHEVTGYDVDEAVLESLRDGFPDVSEQSFQDYVRRALANGLSTSREAVPADVHFVCVPTPYDYQADRADLSAVEASAETIAGVLRRGDLVVLESTVPPGTTHGTVAPILSGSGVSVGEDVELAYSPETLMPGNVVAEIRENDRIVGGVDRVSTETAAALYEAVCEGAIHRAPNATTAEFVKLAQNAFRDLNVAYANMLALVAADYGVEVREAIELANNHPRVDVLDPGPGVGGHCLPVDPLFLGERSEETDLVDSARRVNDRMPDYVINRLAGALGTLDHQTIAILGVTYKGNVSDTRNSPGLAMARRLAGVTRPDQPLPDGGEQGIEVRLHDPHARDESLDLRRLADAVDGADAVVIAAAHDEFRRLDPDRLGSLLDRLVVVDPLDVLDAARWQEFGYDVVGL